MQPPDPGEDHFTTLGAQERYDLDTGALEQRYKDLTKVLHPDRWARADPRARRFSLQRSVQLNEGYRVLRDPVRRAEYMLERAGIAIPVAVPQALLLDVMDLREALQGARNAGDTAKIAVLAADVEARRARSLGAVAEGLRGPKQQPEDAAAALVTLRYWQRFLDEAVAGDEDEPQEAQGG